jgi:hypothetical protein
MPAVAGLAAFFPAGTGSVATGGASFATDTNVSVADNGINGFMVISSK